MKIACIQHVEAENLGWIQEWIDEKRYQVNYFRPDKGEPLPELDSFDFLILLGGSQSVNDLATYPYLRNEIQFLQQVLSQQKLVLGICLGAQLIAAALGGQVIKSHAKEIGQFSITLNADGENDPVLKCLSKQVNVIHWHGEMVEAFPKISVLAHSPACANQAFRYRQFVYGLQFHLELTFEAVKKLIAADPDYITPSQYVQNREQLLQNDYSSTKQLLFDILEALCDQRRLYFLD